MSAPAPIVAPLSSALLSSARQLTLPLIGTSVSVGASMFLGDVACQWIVHKQARTQLMQEHMDKQAAAQTAAAQGGVATAAATPAAAAAAAAATLLPLPDFDALLAYRAPPLPSPSPVGALPALPDSLLSLAPSWWNSRRSLSMLCSGLVFGGPWQFGLMRGGEVLFPGRSGRAIAQKMLLNFAQAPASISATFYLTNRLQGRHDGEAFARIRNDMPSTFASGTLYWPFVSFLNLRFVDLAYRPVVGSIAGSFWNIYVSSQANSKVNLQPSEMAAATATATATAAALPSLTAAATAPTVVAAVAATS